jgi:hypothetical protein
VGHLGRAQIEAAYGFAFPEDLYAFHAFASKYPDALDAVEVGLTGPFSLLRGKPLELFRYYDDPPEFFTVMVGHTDGLHWGYWFDDPEELPPVVTDYYSRDGLMLGPPQDQTLFEAFRRHLEYFHRDAVNYVQDDPDHADSYQQRLDDYAQVREQLAEFVPVDPAVGEDYVRPVPGQQLKRKISAPGAHGMGIVVPLGCFRPLPIELTHHLTDERVQTLFQLACRDAVDDFAGGALQLGHHLWTWREYHEESYDLLDLAYEQLGREVLRTWLQRAITYRRECDARR